MIGSGQWRKWVVLVVLALVVSAFEVAGAAMVFLLVTVVTSPTGPIEMPILGDLREVFGDVDSNRLLLWLIGALASFFILRAVVRVGSTYVEARVAHNAGARLSKRLAGAYLSAPYSFHLQRNSASLMRNAHVAVSQMVAEVFLPVIRIAAESVVVTGLAVLMLTIAPDATLIAVGVVGSSAVIVLLFVQPRLRRLGQKAHIENERTLSLLQESLQGVREVKLFGRLQWFAKTYGRARYRLARLQYLRITLGQVPRALIEFALIAFILTYFGFVVVTEGESVETIPVLGLFAYVGLRLQPSIQKIVAGLNSLKFSSAPMQEIESDLRAYETELPQSSGPKVTFERQVELRDVCFTYEDSDTPALDGINLVIRKGEIVGICGPTGGGKSTLVDVIAGLLEPQTGSVVVDGIDISDRIPEWQKNLGVVSQDTFLLDATLRRNVAFGVDSTDIDDALVREAIQLAQLEDFVSTLPLGMNTNVGERGARVSGGQRQRIAIARALYREPEVLIFDEGTSALDNETEALLMENIEGLRESHTIILVAHRLSTVRNTDRVFLVENGHLVADGLYEDVIGHAG